MAVLSYQNASRAGIALTFNALAGGGDSFENDGSVFLLFKNASGAPITVTVGIAATVDGQTPAGRAYSVPAGGQLLIEPFPPGQYNDTNKRVNMTYSTATDLTLALFHRNG